MTAPAQWDSAPVALVVLRRSQHILFLGLTVLGTIRTVAAGVKPVLTVVLSMALAGWYALGVATPYRHRAQWAPRLWLLLLAIGWAALVAISPDFVWLAFTLFLLCMQVLPLRSGLAAVAVLTGASVAAFWLHRSSLDVPAVLGPVIGAAIAAVITVVYRDLGREVRNSARLLADLTAAQQQLAATARQTGAMTERDRLAREIHDTVAQSLSSIILLLRSARAAYVQAPPAAGRQLSLAETAAQSALEDTRRLVRALTPAELAGRSLRQALGRLAEHTSQLGLDCSLVVEGEEHPLPTTIDVALLRVAQEALANVRVHAGASRAVITLTYLPQAVSLDVADNGQGFDPRQPPRGTHGSGLGLTVMRSRITEVGGSLTIEAAPGQGTALNATIPIGDQQ